MALRKDVVGRMELRPTRVGEFFLRLKARNGEILMHSEGYKRKRSARHCRDVSLAIFSGKQRGYFKIIEGKDGKFYVALRAMNHRTLMSTQGYKSRRFAVSREWYFKKFYKEVKLVRVR